MTIQAYAAHKADGKLESFEYELGSLKPDEVEIDIEYCGICHSDLHMLKNEWSFTQYPFVAGHEIIGKVSAIGDMVSHLKIGQYVGVGWRARSCLICDQCLSGHHNRCLKGEDVIIGRHGGFADKVRCQAVWAFPLPKNINIKTAGHIILWGDNCFQSNYSKQYQSYRSCGGSWNWWVRTLSSNFLIHGDARLLPFLPILKRRKKHDSLEPIIS
jgi:alcohol/geraniol dehydrogenase (NADP+)